MCVYGNYHKFIMFSGVGAAIANPFDLIKTRYQATLPNEPLPYRSVVGAFVEIISKEGVGGLYKAWAVTSARGQCII